MPQIPTFLSASGLGRQMKARGSCRHPSSAAARYQRAVQPVERPARTSIEDGRSDVGRRCCGKAGIFAAIAPWLGLNKSPRVSGTTNVRRCGCCLSTLPNLAGRRWERGWVVGCTLASSFLISSIEEDDEDEEDASRIGAPISLPERRSEADDPVSWSKLSKVLTLPKTEVFLAMR